jgi:hypothetical protein
VTCFSQDVLYTLHVSVDIVQWVMYIFVQKYYNSVLLKVCKKAVRIIVVNLVRLWGN